MTGMCQVNADLVHASSFRKCADDAELVAITGGEPESLLHSEACHRRYAVRMYRLLQVDLRGAHVTLPENGSLYRPFFLLWPAPDDRQILLSDPSSLHLLAQEACRLASLCNQCESTGFTIESIDDRNLAAIHDLVGQEVPETIPECIRLPRFAWVGLEERGLIDDDELRRFVDDLKCGYDLLSFRKRIVLRLEITMYAIRRLRND